MNKKDLLRTYHWVVTHMPEEEKKIINSKNPRLLTMKTDNMLGIELKSKLSLIMEAINPNPQLKTR